MNGRKEGIIFYESQLPRKIVEECKAKAQDEMSYVAMLIEKYKYTSNDIHNKLIEEKK